MSHETPIKKYSQDIKRNQCYCELLTKAAKNALTVQKLAEVGAVLMSKAKLHAHFFADFTFETTALYLAFFSLDFPYEFEDTQYLDYIVNEEEVIKIIELFEERISKRIPVEYITHEAFYLDHIFYVNEHVLVPRSVMNTQFNDLLNKVTWQNNRVLDLCTGSGCIGISLALLNQNISVDLVDISEEALKVALINIQKYHLTERVHCIQSDLFNALEDKYDLIISNPPYVSDKEYQLSPPEFKNEPVLALKSGKEGLDIIERILNQARNYLTPHGLLVCEVGGMAANRLKKRYGALNLIWLKYKKSQDKQSQWDKWIFNFLNKWFGVDCIFVCKAHDLPVAHENLGDKYGHIVK